jgi:Tfp pilus assembly protein PilP
VSATATGAYGGSIRRTPTIVAVLAALLLTACGQSAEEKAQNTVCDARDDISEQVNELKGLTPATFTKDAASKNVSAIRSDLSDIKGALSDLSDDRRRQVEHATEAFARDVEGVVKQIGTSVTAGDAASTVTSSLQQLASSYRQAFSPVDCS